MPLREASRLLLSLVVPRPIAWVSTLNADGAPNLAPFSFFNEFEIAKLETLASVEVKPPRIAAAAVAMEAKATQIIPVEGSTSTMILGRILRYHIREDLLRTNGLVDAALLKPITRLGGEEYATLGRVFEMARPQTNK